jgi:hypothetical protein
VVAEADRLWWVNVIAPDGEDLECVGGGTTPAEAAAVAWILCGGLVVGARLGHER